jgi:hypothetical protein
MDHETLLQVGAMLNDRCQRGVQNLLPEELDYIFLWELNAEIDDGTFDRYLCNSCGDRAIDVVGALERLGSVQMVGVLKRALSLLPGGWCLDLDQRRIRVMAVPNYSQQFRALTEEYYNALSDEDVVSERMMVRIADAYRRAGIL